MNIDKHASIDDLLEIKDGLENAMSAHVHECGVCQFELDALRRINHELFAIADQRPSPDLWHKIERAAGRSGSTGVETPLGLQTNQHSQNRRARPRISILPHSASNDNSLSRAIYTLAASILVTGFIGLYMFGQNHNSSSQNELMQASIQQLMINSRGMEQALQTVSLDSELLSVAERSRADRLYWQLAYLDQEIHQSKFNPDSDQQRLEVLWGNRVRALRDLNQLYYQRQLELQDSKF